MNKPPYEITRTVLDLYGQINELLGTCGSFKLVKPEAHLRRENRIKTIHSTLAIEGNMLSLDSVSTIIDNNIVVGPKKDILEVKNAIKAYELLETFNPLYINDFFKAHETLMMGLVDNPGKLRSSQIGILKGEQVVHIGPSYKMISSLMDNLFLYLKDDNDLEIIKSCVFHYETEFIHPFEDGNGRIGRLWQTRILMNVHPIFEYVPIEELIKKEQDEYYNVLSVSDKSGKSTAFIEFMLNAINESLKATIERAKS